MVIEIFGKNKLRNEQYSHRINYFQTQSTSYMYHVDPVYAMKMSSWQSHLSLYIYHDHLGMFILSSLSILPDPLDKSSRQESYMYWCFSSGAHALCTLFRFFFKYECKIGNKEHWKDQLQNEQYSHRINYFQTKSTSYMYHVDHVYALKNVLMTILFQLVYLP